MPKVHPLLTPEEIDLWRHLEAQAPQGSRVLPLVPLVFFLNEVPQDLQGEAVPFLEVGRSGYPQRAYLYEEGPVSALLESLGLPVSLVSPKGETLPPEREPAPEGLALPPPPPPPSREAPPEEEPLAPTSPYARLADAFWRGELTPEELRAILPQAPLGGEAKGESPPKEAPPQAKEDPVPSAEEAEGELGPPACPLCGSPMVLRVAKRGRTSGREFWGCIRYPACKGTRPYG